MIVEFRGKVKNYDPMTTPNWALGYLYTELRKGDIHYCITDGAMVFEVIPESVGQFTGLYDSMNKEIFEGDIIKLKGDDNEYVIEFNFGAFGACRLMRFPIFDKNSFIPLFKLEGKKITIIDKVYERRLNN